MTRRWFTWLLALGACGLLPAASPSDDKKGEERKGTVTGKVVEKGGNWIEVRADGEEKARKYYTGSNQNALKAVKDAEVGSRVRLEWRFEEVFRVVAIETLKAGEAAADDKKEAKKDEKDRKGTVTGLVTAKGDNWIEVKADGEEKGRRYVPHWRGDAPDKGGGPDKEMVAKIKETPLKSRVRIEWVFEERPRVEKIEVLKKPDAEKPETKK